MAAAAPALFSHFPPAIAMLLRQVDHHLPLVQREIQQALDGAQEMSATRWKIRYVENQLEDFTEILRAVQTTTFQFRAEDVPEENKDEYISRILSCGQCVPRTSLKVPIKSSPHSIHPDYSFLPELPAKRISLLNHLVAKVNALFAKNIYAKWIQDNPVKEALIAVTIQDAYRHAEQCAQLEQEIAALEEREPSREKVAS